LHKRQRKKKSKSLLITTTTYFTSLHFFSQYPHPKANSKLHRGKAFAFCNKKRTQKTLSDPEIFACEGLAKLPIGGYNVPRGGGASVTGCHPEGE